MAGRVGYRRSWQLLNLAWGQVWQGAPGQGDPGFHRPPATAPLTLAPARLAPSPLGHTEALALLVPLPVGERPGRGQRGQRGRGKVCPASARLQTQETPVHEGVQPKPGRGALGDRPGVAQAALG